MTSLRITWPVWMALALCGCATAKPRVSVVGRPVEVQPTKQAPGAPVKGELIAVSRDKVWVMGPQRVSTLPLREVEEVRIPRHGLKGKRAWVWATLGAIVTGATLAIACASVEGNEDCGKIFLPVLATWGAIGVPSAIALAESSQLRVKPSNWDALRPYARFPQGLPEGIDPEVLAPAPKP